MFPTEGFRPGLSKLVDVLDRFGIRFHLTGGITSVAYGDPRMTQDVDLVLDQDQVAAVQLGLLRALSEAGFHFSESTARRAIASGQMFQLLDLDHVIKFDLYVRALIPGELDRSVRAEIFPGVELPIVSRADAILSKLIWIRRGSHRSRRDVRGMVAGAAPAELGAVRRTADELGLSALLDEVLAETDEIDV